MSLHLQTFVVILHWPHWSLSCWSLYSSSDCDICIFPFISLFCPLSRALNEQRIRSEVKGYHSWSWHGPPSLFLCIFTCVLINSCCVCLLWLHPTPPCVCLCVFCIIITFAYVYVCVSVCRTPGESVRDFKALAAASLLDERAVPMFIVTCFSTQGLHKKKTSRDGGINGIKRRKRKQSGINIANRNSFWFRWGLWQWKKRSLSHPALFIYSDTHTVCAWCMYVSEHLLSVLHLALMQVRGCVCTFLEVKLILHHNCHRLKSSSFSLLLLRS